MSTFCYCFTVLLCYCVTGRHTTGAPFVTVLLAVIRKYVVKSLFLAVFSLEIRKDVVEMMTEHCFCASRIPNRNHRIRALM